MGLADSIGNMKIRKPFSSTIQVLNGSKFTEIPASDGITDNALPVGCKKGDGCDFWKAEIRKCGSGRHVSALYNGPDRKMDRNKAASQQIPDSGCHTHNRKTLGVAK